MPRRDLVEWADEAISVFDVLESEFGLVMPRVGRSYKTQCPFSFEHPDGGVEKGFRTYPERNQAHCFVQHGSMGPVRLFSLKHDLRYRKAAEILLERAGLLKRDWRERWNEMVDAREQPLGLGDPQELIQALHEALRRHPNYPPAGISAALSAALASEIATLNGMLLMRPSSQEVSEWYEEAKDRLWAVLDDERAGV